MPDIDNVNPTDNSIVSNFPANERASRTAIEDVLSIEHSKTTGRHQFQVGTDANRDAFTDWLIGGLFLNTKTVPASLQRVISIDPDVWEDIAVPFVPVGTKMSFFQASVPTYWTQDVSQNDKVLRVVNSTGGGSAGGWTITGFVSGSHAITIAEMPAHDHTYVWNPSAPRSGGGVNGGSSNPTRSTGSTGGGGGHTHTLVHDGNWRPAYIDVVIGAKD